MKLESFAARVVDHVAKRVAGAPMHRLKRYPGQDIDIAVKEVACIAIGAIHLAAIVEALADVVVVKVACDGVARFIDVHSVLPMVDAIEADDMPLAADPDAARFRKRCPLRVSRGPGHHPFQEIVGDE